MTSSTTSTTGTPSDFSAARGGMRRLRGRRLDTDPARSTHIQSRAQFAKLASDEIERAKREDQTVLIAALRIRPLPVDLEDHMGRQQLPEELLTRLSSVNPNTRVVARDRDELLLLVPSIRRRPDGEAMVRDWVDVLRPPVAIDELDHHLNPMVGAAMLDRESPDFKSLVDAARLALQECDHTNRVTMFHPYQRVRQGRQETLKSELRAAIVDRRLAAVLQPSFDLATGELNALEVFARWERPERGPVPPLEFVPLAAEIGVEHLLARQVLAAGLTLVDQSRQRQPWPVEPVTVWLNVSPADLLRPEFVDVVVEASSPEHVTVGLELSPSPSADDRHVHQALKRLTAHGLRIAIGDFGIGHANLNVIRQLPFDSVKLDRTLVRQIGTSDEAAGLVEHLVSVAHALGLETTAQGIESAEQCDVVARLGCIAGQGYHFAVPSAEPDDLDRWFTQAGDGPGAEPSEAGERLDPGVKRKSGLVAWAEPGQANRKVVT